MMNFWMSHLNKLKKTNIIYNCKLYSILIQICQLKKMVLLTSVRVDLRDICEKDAKMVLKDIRIKTNTKNYNQHNVFFEQKDVEKLMENGYSPDGEIKLMDYMWLVFYTNPEVNDNEMSKKEIVSMYKDNKIIKKVIRKSPGRKSPSRRSPTKKVAKRRSPSRKIVPNSSDEE